MDSPTGATKPFVSRAGLKLDHALKSFEIDVSGRIAADLGCNAGGFTDCLLRRGAARVYAIDTGYGALDWNLRRDSRVVVMERTNAIHVELPEKVGIVTIDVAWTKQRIILPAALRIVDSAGGEVVALVKPHYEAQPAMLRKGILPAEKVDEVVSEVVAQIAALGFDVVGRVASPITGSKGNSEVLLHLRPRGSNDVRSNPSG